MTSTILDDASNETQVPEFLKSAISELIFTGENIVYNHKAHYSPSRSLKKAHIISDEQSDGTRVLRRYIINCVKQGGVVEVFHITEDKHTI